MQWVQRIAPTRAQLLEWVRSPDGQQWLKAHRHRLQTRPKGVKLLGMVTEAQYLAKAREGAICAIDDLMRRMELPPTTSISSLVEASERSRQPYCELLPRTNNVLVPDAKGDGIADDTAAFQKAFMGRFLPEAPRCECGASKTGIADFAAGHSSWCPVKG